MVGSQSFIYIGYIFPLSESLPKKAVCRLPFGRATQVFQQDEHGACRIIHEHLSSGEPVTPKELPAASAMTAR
jgi:hypothetical protein